jgi:hypothetical protein
MYMAGRPEKCIFWGNPEECTYMAGRPEEGIFCGSPKEWIQRVGRRNIYFWGNSKSGLLRSYST